PAPQCSQQRVHAVTGVAEDPFHSPCLGPLDDSARSIAHAGHLSLGETAAAPAGEPVGRYCVDRDVVSGAPPMRRGRPAGRIAKPGIFAGSSCSVERLPWWRETVKSSQKTYESSTGPGGVDLRRSPAVCGGQADLSRPADNVSRPDHQSV